MLPIAEQHLAVARQPSTFHLARCALPDAASDGIGTDANECGVDANECHAA